MTIHARLVLIVSMLLPTLALADAEYDQKQNIVILNTPLYAEGVDTGWIEIHSKKHILVGGVAHDSTTKKITGLCGKKPSLGLLILDGNFQIGKSVPKVTGVVPFKGGSKSGYVHKYVLKGDDAQDLMDLLLEYRQVGFAIVSECPDSGDWQSGKIVLNFDTRGLERALNRIK